jgi:hypothetical protein
MFHHCIAHPICGLCFTLGFDNLGDKIHDIVLFSEGNEELMIEDGS